MTLPHDTKETIDKPPLLLVVAGATGFVGRALGPVLAKHFGEVRGLTRSAARAGTHQDGYHLVQADLFSMLDCERALEGATHVIYLVHSMEASARLTQGSFRDMDLICADNMARAAKTAGVAQIIYLSGLIPPDADGNGLSEHLTSRLEVERVLGAYGVPVTSLRAGLIIGANGSSFQILRRLVRRLPVMVCPKWTRTPTQPVALDDVVNLLDFCVGEEAVLNRHFDLGCPAPTTYRDMMARTAVLMGLKRRMYNVRVLSPGLSRLWVSVMTGAPRDLVKPLVQSLKHAMVAQDDAIYKLAGITPISFDEAVKRALNESGVAKPSAFRRAPKTRARVVRSVQRLPIPEGRDAHWAAQHYVRWLPGALRPFLRTVVDGERVSFRTFLFRKPLLTLEFSPDRSHRSRQLFYIVAGSLAVLKGRGRLELREVPGEQTLIAAIHDFHPRLPWFIYIYTQAPIHKLVMYAFGRRLVRLGGPPSEQLVEAEAD
ncbi:MAG: hypothetical protein ACI9MR_001823 [Myxococcota bacterium]|jgi:uncharacterized protein YbjT (DUF2867 family)